MIEFQVEFWRGKRNHLRTTRLKFKLDISVSLITQDIRAFYWYRECHVKWLNRKSRLNWICAILSRKNLWMTSYSLVICRDLRRPMNGIFHTRAVATGPPQRVEAQLSIEISLRFISSFTGSTLGQFSFRTRGTVRDKFERTMSDTTGKVSIVVYLFLRIYTF